LQSFTGGVAFRTVTKAFADSPYTLLASDWTVRVNAVGGAIIVNLPTAAAAFGTTPATGRVINVKKVDAGVNTVTIEGAGAETIDGALNVVLTVQWQSVTLQSNGTSWDVL
jgi:hypothetical protein